jgi:branched-chain amino acid transport system substrate-binding protein
VSPATGLLAGIVSIVLADAQRLGINCVIDDGLPPKLNDMSMTLTKVKVLKLGILVVSGHEMGALTAVKQTEALRVDVPVPVATRRRSPRSCRKRRKISPARNNGTTPLTTKASYSVRPRFSPLCSRRSTAMRRRTRRPNQPPRVYVFADAFKQGQNLDPDKVRGAIAATDLPTFFGPIKFDATGTNIAKPMILIKIVDGEYVVVDPEKWAAKEPVIKHRR